MKKFFAAFVSLILCGMMLAFAACAANPTPSADNEQTVGDEESGDRPEVPVDHDSDILVVYFSATGNTERIANVIAEATGGNIFELVPVDPYTSADLRWTDENSRVVQEYENPELRNLDNEIWTPGVREAFQYIFDREQIKNIANYYAITSYYPMMSMAPSETEQYMSEEGLAYLEENFTFSYNQQRATELLEQEGWVKNGDQWYRDGQPVTLLLAYDGSNSYFRTSAEVAASQLNAFGIPTTFNRYGEWGTFYTNAIEQGTDIDIVISWTDLNMTMPYGSFSYAYDGPVTDLCHVPRYQDGDEGYALYGGRPALELTGLDGQTFEAAGVFPGIYSISDPEELATTTDNLVIGMARNLYGVQFFQNVTGAFWNIGKVAGLPHEEEVLAQRNYTYIPSEGEDFDAWAKINVLYSYGTVLTDGTLYPRNPEEATAE